MDTQANPLKVKIHGTYPFDEWDANYTRAWKHIQELTKQEAAVMAKVPESPDGSHWMNKGFIILELREQDEHEGVTTVQAAIGELMGGVLSPNVKPGMKAVYNHDGKYYLIERVLPHPSEYKSK